MATLQLRLIKRGKKCDSLAKFRELITWYRREVASLISEVRREVKDELRGSEKTIGNVVRFAIYYRLAVWRKALDTLMLSINNAVDWREGTRTQLWKELVEASNARWYCMSLEYTFRTHEMD